jgi:F-type H+-transporting ATPase subunit alpha
MTALPIIETEAQNISAYIPTNLISITDGQLYLSPDLFRKGILPPVDVGRSVSRVGGKTQLKAYRKVAGDLRLSYSQFEELESFARFGTRLDEDTRKKLERGRRVREIFKQPRYATLGVCEQIAALVAVNFGVFDEIEEQKVSEAEKRIHEKVRSELGELCESMEKGEKLEDEDVDRIVDVARRSVEEIG